MIRTVAPDCPLHPDVIRQIKLHLLSLETKKATPQIFRNPRGREKRPQQESRYRQPCQMCHHILPPKGSLSSPCRQMSARRHCGVTRGQLKGCSPQGGQTCSGFPGRGCRCLCVRRKGHSGRVEGSRETTSRHPSSHTHPDSAPSLGISSGLAAPLVFLNPGGSSPAPDPAPPLDPSLVAARHSPRTVPSSPLLPLSPPPAHPFLSLSSSHSYPPPRRSRDPLTGLGRG